MLINYQLLFQSIGDAILMLDKEGIIKYANPAATSITGYAADELLNQPLSILYNYENDNIRVEYELELALKKGKLLVEGWKMKKDKTGIWAEISLSPLYDEQNSVTGFSCILRDVSERKMREIEYKQSEEQYRLMVEGVKDYAIFMMDVKGYILTWNQGAERTKGYSPNEIIGKHFSIFYTADDLNDKKPERELKIAVATGKYEEEGWRVRKNGTVFWANVVITALFNNQNQLIGFSKVTRDLTERKENEERLRQSEERYRLLVEQVLDYVIYLMDERGRIVSWNEGAKRIKGYNAEEVIGKHFSIFYPEEDIINDKPALELRLAKKEGKYEEEGWRIRKDGSRFWANILITPVYNSLGTLIGYSKVTRDLTEKKLAEEEIKESYRRYRMIAEELKLANTELSYANQELEQFTSIVSHDLQEPVRTIRSFLQLIDMRLKEDKVSDELKTYIGKATMAALRMKDLIQNLLNYAQLSREETINEEVNVNELLNEALQNLKTSVDISKAKIKVKNEVDVIEGNRVQLLQVLQNLLSNALKFTNAKNPKVEIKCFEENGVAKFSISDNGIGIAQTDLNKVFEIFRRLNTEKEFPGTGIGLAICKKIIDRHHGKIWPESELGKGTTFYFTLNKKFTPKLSVQ